MIKRIALAALAIIALLSAPQTASAAKNLYVGNQPGKILIAASDCA
jgi:hypothetical protein